MRLLLSQATKPVGHVAQLEWAWIHDWSAEIVRFVLADVEHGAANREVLAGWIADWLPQARAATDALEPVFAELPKGAGGFAAARANVEIDRAKLFDAAELRELAMVAQ